MHFELSVLKIFFNIKQRAISIQKYFGHSIEHINFSLTFMPDLIMRIGMIIKIVIYW